MMVITDYRVQSVLRTYCRQLLRSKLSDDALPEGQNGRVHFSRVSISDEAKRRVILTRVTADVLERTHLRQVDSSGESECAGQENLQKTLAG